MEDSYSLQPMNLVCFKLILCIIKLVIRIIFLSNRRNRLLSNLPLRPMGQTTNLKLILVNMDKIINCMFLNPGWEHFHKSHGTTGIGMEKTHEPRVSVITTQESRTKTQKPSFLLFCFSLNNYCMCLHAIHYSGRSIPLLSGCQEQLFPAKQTALRSHFPEV